MTADYLDEGGSSAVVVAWQRLGSATVLTTPCFDVRSDSIVRPDGERDSVAYVMSPGSVTVLAVDEDDTVVLTRRWIYIRGGTEWRLPGGAVPASETDYAAVARRELAAETGLRAQRLRSLGVLHGADDFCDHADHLFLATQLSPDESSVRRNGISPRVRRLSFAQAVDLVLSGQLPHAGSSHALLLTALDRARG